MNQLVTSKEKLLDAAKQIAYQKGLKELNIRSLAALCGVSVGSVYNYFTTKSDLVWALIEDFWKTAFHGELCSNKPDEPFTEYLGRFYQALFDRTASFREGFLSEISAFGEQEKQRGRELESRCFDRIRAQLLFALDSDPLIPASAWDKCITKERFVSFTFSNLMELLRRGEPDCRFLQAALTRMLCPAGSLTR